MKKERDEKKEREARLLKRQQLKILSQSLVARRNLGEYMGNEDDTVNGLLRFYYACKGYTNLKTFKEWKEAGYTVRKGEKALRRFAPPLGFASRAGRQRAVARPAARGQPQSKNPLERVLSRNQLCVLLECRRRVWTMRFSEILCSFKVL